MEGSVPHARIITFDIGYPPGHIVDFCRYNEGCYGSLSCRLKRTSSEIFSITLAYSVLTSVHTGQTMFSYRKA